MIFYDGPNSIIEWEEENQTIVVTRKEGIYVEGADFKPGANKILEAVTLNHAPKFMGRFESLRIINREDQQWLIDDWGPHLYAAGLRYLACTKPRGYAAYTSLKNVLDELVWQGIKTGLFDTEEEARKWLTSYT